MAKRKTNKLNILVILVFMSLILQLYLNKQKLDLSQRIGYHTTKEELYQNDDIHQSKDITLLKIIIIKVGELIFMKFES